MKRLRKWLIGLLVMLPGVCFGQVNGTNTSTFTFTKNATNFWGDVVVAGLTGLTPGQVGLGNVENVSWNSTLKAQYDGYAANVTTLLNNYRNSSVAISGNDITNLTWTKLDNVPAYTTSNQATNTTSDVVFGNVNATTFKGDGGNLTGLPAGGNASWSTTGGATADNLTVVVSAGLIKDAGRTLASVGYGNGTSNYTSANFTVDLASSGANSKGFTYYNITNTSDFNFDISAGSKNITAVYMLCNGGTNVTGVLEKHDINGTFKAAVNASAWVAVNNTGLWITSFGNATMVANETLYWNSTSVNGAPTFFTLKVYYGN
jgi:hypothetical protein